MRSKPLPDQVFLQECFSYNPCTGELRWRERPLHHFKTAAAHKQFNVMRAGQQICNLATNGYLTVNFTGVEYKGQYRAHRLIYMLIYGEDPGELIDHFDRDKTNNRLSNLRPASKAINNHNGALYSRNKSGYRGVTKHGQYDKYTAQITIGGKKKHLGCFCTPEEAHTAYITAADNHYKGTK